MPTQLDTMTGSLVICMWSQLSYPKVYVCKVELLGNKGTFRVLLI